MKEIKDLVYISKLPKNKNNFFLFQHLLFDKNQTLHLGRKSTGTPCLCSGCLIPPIVQSNHLHFYVQGILFLPKERKVVDTKLRVFLLTWCTNGITSSNNDIKPFLNQEILVDPHLNAASTREKESLVRQDANNGVEVLINFDGDHSFVYDYLYS